MAITVCGNCINFGSQSICVDPAGIYVSGRFDFFGCSVKTQAQGSVSGYSTAGCVPGRSNVIDKFPFASDGNATDVGDLTSAIMKPSGQSSSTNGYTSGGNAGGTSFLDTIQKFPFASDTNATDIAELTVPRADLVGQSSSTNGYASGGCCVGIGGSSPVYYNVIDKFPFASDGPATDVGDLTQARFGSAGQSSLDNGYTSGGNIVGSLVNIIDKFPFASDSNATDVGDLFQIRRSVAGQSSSTCGYSSGGLNPVPSYADIIDKFPFASDSNATDVGELTLARAELAGQSSTVSGYTSGGIKVTPPYPGPSSNTIDKFPFVSDSPATDVGDLTQQRRLLAGQQS